ncbi:MAG: hypothetical protein RLZZ136_1424 [Pseudomonadota bacterium]|jgi:hypothetical protein
MVRLLLYAAIASLICKQFTGRWPWDYLRGQTTRNQALSRARALLGVSADASRAEILEAHKRLIAMVHPDRGGTTDQVYEANAARDLLLNTLLS